MGWNVLIPIIAQYGIPLVEKLFEKWSSGNAPTAQDFVDLRAAASQTAKDRLVLALQAKGIDPASPQGQQLLALM